MLGNISLDSYWKFITDKDNEGIENKWFDHIPDNTENIWVPSCWNELREDLLYYDGTAWYYKTFYYRENPEWKRQVLFFQGVNYRCEIWLNGQKAGRHVGGSTPFELDVTDYLNINGENFIAVRVDSTIDDMTSPPKGVDWFNYGGIYREVSLVGTGETWLDDVTITTKLSGEIGVKIDIGNYSAGPGAVLEIKISEKEGAEPIQVSSHDILTGSELLKLFIPDVKLWSPEDPYLYDFELILKNKHGKTMDIWKHRIGVREFSIKDRKVQLNGKPVFLRGYSKHEDYPLMGRTFSPDILRKDYEMCKQGNANFLRLCHYPHHIREYGIASEMGMLVIAEVPNVNFKKEQFANPELMELAINQLKETIKYYKNETCIMFWSLFIECKTYEDSAVDFVPKYIKLAKELDSTRFTVHASDIPTEDRTYEFFDIIGVNYWLGWYISQEIEEGSRLMDTIAARYPDKPVLITSGGWEGMYGYHSYVAKSKWSEESQADYLDDLTDMYISKDYIVGQIVWTFNDFRVSPWVLESGNYARFRPMGINHKGVTDYFRRPKLAYYRLQETFKKWSDKI
ncbi:MAG: glycoside hydrolase family 2 protein [Eubacterium sp.]|nr:glycoside hydrolase family 2 protein [Eubacterium sp.]